MEHTSDNSYEFSVHDRVVKTISSLSWSRFMQLSAKPYSPVLNIFHWSKGNKFAIWKEPDLFIIVRCMYCLKWLIVGHDLLSWCNFFDQNSGTSQCEKYSIDPSGDWNSKWILEFSLYAFQDPHTHSNSPLSTRATIGFTPPNTYINLSPSVFAVWAWYPTHRLRVAHFPCLDVVWIANSNPRYPTIIGFA